jgi:hypothetical protein
LLDIAYVQNVSSLHSFFS